MTTNKKILALICARGDSKGLPNKNILPCAGKPLISWSIEAALGSKYIDEVIVSSDCEKILSISRQYGARIPFKRPDHLANDTAGIAAVAAHTLEWLTNEEGKTFDVLILLQATSPLRNSSHIDEAISIFTKEETHPKATLVSVYKAPEKVGWLLSYKEDMKSIDFCFNVNSKAAQRQGLPSYFLPNGAIYIAIPKYYDGDFYSEHTIPYIMEKECSIDIDTKEELALAEEFLKKAQASKNSNPKF